MPDRRWLEALRDDLARRGLPAGYVNRFLRELEDHIEDVSQEREESMRTDAEVAESVSALEVRLGGREELADQAAAEYRRANFAGRHPVWTFVVAPVPALILSWALFLAAGALGFDGAAYLITGGKEVPETEVPLVVRRALYAYFYGSAFVPPALVTLWWCRFARRSGRGWKWGLASCLLVATIAGTFVSQLEEPTPSEKGSLMLGLGVGGNVRPWQIAQFAVPLLTAAGYACWAGRSAQLQRTAGTCQELMER